MRRKLSDSNDLLRQTQKIFGEYIEPTAIPQAEFYKLFKPKMAVGEGAYGTIKCVENCYSEPYAIKESKDTEDTYGLYREFSVMKKFNHPNLLKAIGFFQVKETHKLIILTEFCKYKSLKTFSSYFPSLSLREKVRLCVQIFNGIYALHQKKIMHRDLKPQNVLIDQNKRAKICDFGFCTYDNQTNLSKTQRVGTPLYNSPETDMGTYTKKCDIFSYGLIVYFIFSNGKHLFKKNEGNKDLQTLRDQHFKNTSKSFGGLDAPDKIKYLLENTITQKQEKRYSTEQVRQLWQRFISHHNMKGLKVGELKEKYGSMLFLDEEDQKFSERQATNQLKDHQKLALELIVRRDSHSNAIKDSEQFTRFLHSLAITEKGMAEFKTIIEKINLKTAEKHIMTFACMVILQIHFYNLFQVGIRLLDCGLVQENRQLHIKAEDIIKRILQMRQNLGKNLAKSLTYLQRHQKLLKPSDLFSNFITNSLEQSKKLQKLIDLGLSSETEIEKFKTQRAIESNRLLFETVLKQCKINIDRSKFKVEIDEVIRRFRSQKCNLSNQDEIALADQMLSKIKKIQYLKI